MLSNQLSILINEDYANEYNRLTGLWPSQVPTSGVWPYIPRTWKSYFHTI